MGYVLIVAGAVCGVFSILGFCSIFVAGPVGLFIGGIMGLISAGLIVGGLYLSGILSMSKNKSLGEIANYLNSNLNGDNSANKILREYQIMDCFSKVCNSKLTNILPIEKLIQNHNELNSIIETSTAPWNNEMKVHTMMWTFNLITRVIMK